MAIAGMLLIVGAGLVGDAAAQPQPRRADIAALDADTDERRHAFTHPDRRRRAARAAGAAPTPPVLLDASFDLADAAAGERAYARRPSARRALRAPRPRPVRRRRPAATAATRCPTRDAFAAHRRRARRRAGDAGGRATTRQGGVYAARAVVDAALARPRRGRGARRRLRGLGGGRRRAHGRAAPTARRRGALPRAAVARRAAIDADDARPAARPARCCSTPAPASAFAARSSRSTRSPATSPARSTASSRTTCGADGRFKPADDAARRVRTRCSARARPREVVHSVRLGRHRLPQPAGDGARRPRRLAALSGLVERVVGRPARPIATGWT